MSKKEEQYAFDNKFMGLIPESLDLDRLLQKKKFEVTYNRDKPHYVRGILVYFITTIMRKSKERYENEVCDSNNPYVRLCSEYFQNITKNYKQYINYLIENEVIETNSRYKIGAFCTGFRITEKYNSKPKIEWVYDRKLIEKLEKILVDPHAIETHTHQYEQLQKLTYDEKLAARILDEIYPEDQSVDKQIQQYNLEYFGGKRKQYFHIGNTGRLYSPFNQIKSELRQAIRYQEQELNGIDIRSSIPTIVTTLFTPRVYQLVDKAATKQPEIHTTTLRAEEPRLLCRRGGALELSADAPYRGARPHYMLGKNGNIASGSCEVMDDISQFIEEVWSGMIYEIVETVWNDTLGTDYTRETAKTKFLQIINTPNYVDCPEKECLKDLYPNVIKEIDNLNGWFKLAKNVSGKRRNTATDGIPWIAYYTQTLESILVLDNVCGRINQEDPTIPLFTVHDAIYTTRQHVEYVNDVLLEESHKLFGFKVKTAIDDYYEEPCLAC